MKIKTDTLKELLTIRDYVRYAVTEFTKANLHYGHGTDNPWDEATWLISHVLHLSPIIENNLLDARLTHDEKLAIIELLQKRIKTRKPVAYLTKQAWFADLPFYVDERVLIPRSSISELIEKHFAPWVEFSQVKRILDIGTGSGCIAIACALAFPEVQVDAVDVSDSALKVAHMNVAKHNVADQVKLIKSDVFASIKNEIYDIIVSNPPYVAKAEMHGLPAEYSHEPKLALEAGITGLNVVVKILKDAAKHLSPHGALIVEVGNSDIALQKQFPHLPFTWLEFEKGEGGVFLLTADELKKYKFSGK